MKIEITISLKIERNIYNQNEYAQIYIFIIKGQQKILRTFNTPIIQIKKLSILSALKQKNNTKNLPRSFSTLIILFI